MVHSRSCLLLFAGIILVLLVVSCGCTADSQVMHLVDDLYSGDQQTQREASEALVEIGTPAINPLIGVFSSGDRSASMWAAVTLCEIGEPSIDPLIEHLPKGNEESNEWAVNTLACIGTPAIDPLLNELQKKDVSTRIPVSQALIKIGLPAVPGLHELQYSGDSELNLIAGSIIASIYLTEDIQQPEETNTTVSG
jgi:HEAT repeat protein